MAIKAFAKNQATGPRVLVVDDEPAVAELMQDIVGDLGCQVVSARSVREATAILGKQKVDVMLADVHLPDGSGLSLLGEMRRLHPSAEAVVVTAAPDVEGAITALRGGAADFLRKPFNSEQLTFHLRSAIAKHDARVKAQERVAKLKDAVRRLNAARKTVNRKVDLLCNDLVNAYGDLSRQMETVRVGASFRDFLDRSKDLEQMLCHTMDWFLRQVGYCNIGIWLAGERDELQLGAYMKYTIAAEKDLTGSMEAGVLKTAIRRGFLRLRGIEAKGELTPAERKFLTGQDVVAAQCTYLGETIGALALFRDEKTPFSDADIQAMQVAIPLLSLALARMVRDGGDDQGEAGAETTEGTKGDAAPGKSDPADWWKRGEDSPY